MINSSWVQLLVEMVSSAHYLDGWLSANR